MKRVKRAVLTRCTCWVTGDDNRLTRVCTRHYEMGVRLGMGEAEWRPLLAPIVIGA